MPATTITSQLNMFCIVIMSILCLAPHFMPKADEPAWAPPLNDRNPNGWRSVPVGTHHD